MRIQELSVNKPVTLLMIFLAGIIFGVISLGKMDVDILPPIQYPEISIITLYAGASPQEIETLITRPIEEAVNGVAGVKRVRSESIEGASLVVATFNWNTDLDYATIRIREKVDLVKGVLPQDVEKSIVARFDPNAQPIMGISIKGNSDIDKIRRIVEKEIKPKFERIDGVGSAKIIGGVIKEIQVMIDLPRLYAHGLSIYDVLQAVTMSNYNFPAGTITRGNKELLIRTIGEFKTLEDIEDVMVKKSKSGRAIYVRDIAKVAYGYKDRTSISFFNGKESISLGIIKESGKNTVRVCENVRQLVSTLNEKYSKTLDFSINYDGSGYINNSINSVSSAAIEGGIIAFFIILIFLKDLRISLIITTVIPSSIMITLLLMYMKGISLNMMSLGGLALGVGHLVDSGIVVIESIQKMIQRGKPLREACVDGTSDVIAPLLSSTLTCVVVFLPIIFVPGIAGEFFSEMAFTVSISLIISYIVAISLVPALFVLLEDKKTGQRPIVKKKSLIRQFMSNYIRIPEFLIKWIAYFENTFDRFFSSIEKNYETLITAHIGKFRVALMAGVGSFIFGLLVFFILHTSFLPETDSGSFTIRIISPKGTPLTATRDIILQVDSIVAGKPYVHNRIIDVGYNPDEISEYFGRERNKSTAEMMVTLNEKKNVTTREAMDDLKKTIKLPDNIKIEYISDEREFSSLAGILSSSAQVDVFGEHFADIDSGINVLLQKFKATSFIRNPYPTVEKEKPEIKIDIDKEKLASFGLTISDVAEQLRASIKGDEAGKFYMEDDEIDITVRLDEAYRASESQIPDITIRTNDNKNIPLSAFARTIVQQGYNKIIRKDQKRCFSITCESTLATGELLEKINTIIKNTPLLKGTNASIGGEIQEIRDSINGLIFALLLSIVLIYMIIASQFESLTKPLIIMLSIPLTISGISLSLLLTGNTISIISVMGMVILSGIVVNNSIVLLDCCYNYINKGMSLEQAIIQGGKDRLRPILMTSLTTVLGLIPLALGLAEGGEMQAPMAITLMGGMMVSTILTLVLIPMYYYKFEKHKSSLSIQVKK